MTDIAHRMNAYDVADATVPLPFMKRFEHESLRWPPHLDHADIVSRLVAIRETAPSYRHGLEEVPLLFKGVEHMSARKIADSVLSALAWTEKNPGYGFLAEQLQILAVNLKNLH
jgi:hypothetical protein